MHVLWFRRIRRRVPFMNTPRRQVAVKVMLSEVVNDQVRTDVPGRARRRRNSSSQPSILTVYQASVSSDGRPYS
jgi:hypothetical protein